MPAGHCRYTSGDAAFMADMKTTIKTVCIDLFFKKGYFATSISDIAGAAASKRPASIITTPAKRICCFVY
jgi:hypothetical protein